MVARFQPDGASPATKGKPKGKPKSAPKAQAAAPAGNGIVDADPEPWPEAVNGAELLHDIANMLGKHVVMPEHGAVVCALWALHTWCFACFTYSPRLLLSSPVKRSGKTLLLRLLAALVTRPLTAEGISAAALYRVISAAHPTLLLDEYDTFLIARRDASEAAEALRGVVNSGFQRGGRIVRCSGDKHEPVAFPCYAPVVLAGIGNPPSTVADRSILLAMRRRANGEVVERPSPGWPLRQQHEDLVRRCRRWAMDSAPMLAEAEPEIPAGLHDRAADCWWSLLSIADAAGEHWPELARDAAIALSAARADEEEDAGILLLRDLRDVFGNEDRLPTVELLRLLAALDGAPWATWHHGRDPLTSHGLARLLRPFDIRSTTFRMPSGATPKGYVRAHLDDAFLRYLPAPPA